MPNRVLISGAAHFAAEPTARALAAKGVVVRCATRHVGAAAPRRQDPRGAESVHLDAHDQGTIDRALDGCNAVVHFTEAPPPLASEELALAERLTLAMPRHGIRRAVYLGALPPVGQASPETRARLLVGDILRSGPVPVCELASAMIVGRGGAGWQIVRDLATRLPRMILPELGHGRLQPVALDDVVFALGRALDLPKEACGSFPLVGPETLSIDDMLARIARARGASATSWTLPLSTPWLTSYWLTLVTRGNYGLVREIVDGLASDRIVEDAGFWAWAPSHVLTRFDVAARRALEEDEAALPLGARLLGAAFARLVRRPTRTLPPAGA